MTDPTNYRTNRDLFSNHYLNDHLHDMEAWTEIPDAEVETAFSEIKSILDEKGDRVEDYNEAQLERNVIRPIFEILDIPFEIEETVMRNARRPDYGFFPSEEAADAAFDRENFYQEAIAVADAKRWGRKLDTRGEEKRDFENPSYQIHSYLQETPPQWGVLTNGEKWRLYYGPTSHRLDSYYEIDLPKVLSIGEEEGDLEAFKEFYLFFRQGAFLDDQTGDCFLDDVYDQSTAFAEALGEDLQENIYEAIRVLAEGFLDTNDNLDEEDLDRIHDSSLIYLYRLIFVLYAESEGRNLLPTENEIYSETYSLNDLKQVVVEKRDETQQHYQTWQTDLWDKLDELFVLIDQGSQGKGIPKDDLYIPAYNGGLFRTDPEEDDTVEAQFLSNHEVGDAYIAEVIELLTRHEASEGQGKVFVDYSSLDERNLGSIYEGLLEYTLAVADEPLTVDDGEYVSAGEGDDITVEEGEVYLRTDDGERKATGSYYTPEYVVEYIVDETLGPLVQEIREDLVANSARGDDRGFAEEFADRVFDLTVLDPAMGSGHFPVNAVDYLAREIIDAQEQQDRQALDSADAEIRAPTTEEGELRDINWARRKVAQRCIYGVDVNPLATELAKVSLWLRTLAAEQPLAFLDHHLKTGNSLVGSDIEDVLSDGDEDATGDGQLTLQQSFDHTRQRAMEHVTDRFQDLLNIDNETLEDAKEMEAVYDDVRADPLYKKLLAMANVHTADAFGLDIPSDADERMARALHSDAWEKIEQQDWFKSAQAMAEEQRFFHWELEFPIAFYDQDGERKADAGFDAVIGNPPYMRIQTIRKGSTEVPDYYETSYSSSHKNYDIYALFVEKGNSLLSNDGEQGYIIPHKFMQAEFGTALREYLSDRGAVRKIVDMGHYQVFGEAATTYTCLLFLSGDENEEFDYAELNDDPRDLNDLDTAKLQSNQIGEDPWILLSPIELDAVEKMEACPSLEQISDEIFVGIQTSKDSVYAIDVLEDLGDEMKVRSEETEREYEFSKDLLVPYLKGQDVDRYSSPKNRKVLIFPYHTSSDGYELMESEEIRASAPSVWEYLLENRDVLEARDGGSMNGEDWYGYTYPKSLHQHKKNKILTPEISDNCSFTIDRDGKHSTSVIYSITASNTDYSLEYLLGVLNATPTWFYVSNTSHVLRGGYYRFKTGYLQPVGIPEIQADSDSVNKSKIKDVMNEYQNENYSSVVDTVVELLNTDEESTVHGLFKPLVDERIHTQDVRKDLNLDLLNYLGNYKESPKLPDIGFFQPSTSNILDATTEEYEKLQVERARTKRDGSSVTIEATARYKPEDEDEFETDTYDYTETTFFEAFTLTDLSEEEAALVEAFVPVAVEKEIGGFRDNATKTNSLIDRLKAMTLPDPDDVSDDLQRYIETKERADELDEKIEKTDQLIDEIVYDLYDLTDEEIDIVEEAVTDD
ncbi:restriction endonuclease [Halorubrum ezzemoulense DSM 17463]|uniref:site-specific DNA-methyltransferase (adenine-specific) n=1 Tax=Halorubrum ezzemoulense DSM 17463 TaxID=1121945 RepID=A0A1X4GAG7_HALEZ|nr:Eco57I restriction-modification methylase domain-containing protein [Halorubrum ezzemoulense]OSO94158.1 restriction endonuclease [Halorubrum ezzemoulense DSM 17463]